MGDYEHTGSILGYRDDWQVVEHALRGFQMPEALAALARLREREAQLEQDNQHAYDAYQAVIQENKSAEAAEARVAELEEALRKPITLVCENCGSGVFTCHNCGAPGSASRALAHPEGEA